ncbi:glycosyl hydrolase [Telluria mixta]|uniref:Glycosyl hydrolase n=1 Tax=Telluria mixta TaxID=34071 RepID=A0ABT2BYK3_9BURK|nr:glycosyl hydrolase [Telluria mixta]MCS0630217.1 glycosyl hydrolase [Telluria mixta]WEM94475.1 glycosyl hydrolase [Telluria mixta]
MIHKFRIRSGVLCAALGIAASAPAAPVPPAAQLASGFQDPPNAARPRVWWHWMNGNITRDGIAKDMAWMKQVGIGGLQNFDIDLSTPVMVEKRLAYMTPEWKAAFRFAAGEADRHGLELAIASSPGWSETGGPWVKPDDALKKVVWSDTLVVGGKPARVKLARPPAVAGPFQSIAKQPDLSDLIMQAAVVPGPDYYRDIAVLAVPVARPARLPTPVLTDGEGRAIAGDTRAGTAAIAGVRLPSVISGKVPELRLAYPVPVTVRTLTLHMPGAAIPPLGALLAAQFEASQDGNTWQAVGPVPLADVPTTIGFPAVTARHFRIVLKPALDGGPGGAGPDKGLAMEDVFGKMIGRQLAKPITVGILELSAEPRIDRYEAKAGFALVPDYYALSRVADGAAGADPKAVVDLTGRLRADGTLHWTPPPGTWKILRIGYSLLGTTNHPAPPEATGLETDKFDAGANVRYLEHYLGNYRDATGADLLGKRGVRAILTDSIEVGAANWTPKLIDQFKRLRGYDPTPWLPTLGGVIIGDRDASDKFLYDFRRTLADLISSEYYGTVARVAHAHGLQVYGEALESHRPTLGDDMAMRSHADFPMAAMWTFDRAAGPQASYLADIKGAASVAHVYGQNIVAAESMTANMAPWAFGPADLKRIADLEFALGVNRPVIHTSVHVPGDARVPGLSLGGIGQFFNRHESWAELAKPWVDYLSRNAFMLQQGRNYADVAYFYGEEAPLTGLYGAEPVRNAPTANAYDFVNYDALVGRLANDGGDLVAPSGARYKVLYLGGSSSRMSLAALRRIAALAEGGATVIGMKPTGSPGLADDASAFDALAARLWSGAAVTAVGKGRVIAGSDIDQALRTLGISADFRFTGGGEGADIPFVHRRLDDGDSYFLVNRNNRKETIEAHFRVTGKAPELWHAETGTFEDASYRIVDGVTIVPLVLDAEESVHVVFRKPAAADAVTVKAPARASLLALDGPWTVRFQEGRGAPSGIVMPALAALDQSTDPGVKYFSGIATYAKTFEAPRAWTAGQPLTLVLGDVREVAEVRVNGELAGYAWHAPYRVEIGPFVKPGRNDLEVRVANLWINRLIRDADPAVKDKVTWTSEPTYKADARLRPSGLIGPVTLQGIRH